MECNKKSLPFVYILMTAICSILLLGWAFVSVPTEYGLSATISGFGIIGQWGSVWLVFSALFQIFSIISLVLILITTIWGWLFSAGKAKELKVGSWGLKAISEFLFTIFVGLVILVFIFWTIGVQNVTVGLISFNVVLSVQSKLLWIVNLYPT